MWEKYIKCMNITYNITADEPIMIVQDCNGDGVEDCEDFAQIHFNGGYDCNKPLSVPARNSLRDCLGRFSLPTPPVDTGSSEGNDIFYPKTPTTFPSIDVRLKDE